MPSKTGVVYGAQSAAKRPGYPSGRWHPEAELAQGFRRKLIYLWHWKQVRVWVLLWLGPLLVWFSELADLWPSKWEAGAGGFSVPWAAVAINVILAIAFAVAGTLSLFKLLRSGRPAEGLIVGASDDGIDPLYTVYYEDGPQAYELQFTAKCRSPACRLQAGDTITLILGPPKAVDLQRVVLYPPRRDS